MGISKNEIKSAWEVDDLTDKDFGGGNEYLFKKEWSRDNLINWEEIIAGENQKQEDWKLIEAMEKYGGSFASSIAKACYHADGVNYMKIRNTFPDLFEDAKKFIK